LRKEPVIDTHRYTADVAIPVHIKVAHHGQSFKTPTGVSDSYTRSIRRASGFVQTGWSEALLARANRKEFRLEGFME
jgi:hypothetical protein